jgi:hypothetical protein
MEGYHIDASQPILEWIPGKFRDADNTQGDAPVRSSELGGYARIPVYSYIHPTQYNHSFVSPPIIRVVLVWRLRVGQSPRQNIALRHCPATPSLAGSGTVTFATITAR